MKKLIYIALLLLLSTPFTVTNVKASGMDGTITCNGQIRNNDGSAITVNFTDDEDNIKYFTIYDDELDENGNFEKVVPIEEGNYYLYNVQFGHHSDYEYESSNNYFEVREGENYNLTINATLPNESVSTENLLEEQEKANLPSPTKVPILKILKRDVQYGIKTFIKNSWWVFIFGLIGGIFFWNYVKRRYE